ncbi:hypothetical protein [Providencia sp. T47]|uniref:hypothetical protein n=1 Tax=Providencia sp. T47 TaxID=3395376 RepID=UPI0039BD2F04
MTLDTKVNNQASIFININNKVIPYKKTSVIDNLNVIKPLSSESYNKINFAIQNSEFHESAQPVLNQLPYSPPVEKLLLPYTYHEDDLVSSSDIFKNSIEIKNDSLISEKKDTELMPLNKISTTETKVFKDFRLNRSAGRFSNLILEIKSTHEKGIRYLKNILKKNNNEELCVKFESGKAKIIDKATIARQNLMKQHENINDAKATNNVFYTVQQENSDLYNSYKILLDEIGIVESKANKLIMENSNNKNQSQYHKLFEELDIMDMINSPELSNDNLEKINNTFDEMKSVIKMLENYIDESATNEQLVWDDYDPNWNNLPNESLNTQNKEMIKQNISQDVIDDAVYIINKSDTDIIDDDAKSELNYFFNNSPQYLRYTYYSSNESLNSNSSGYHTNSSFSPSSSKYSSTESLHQEKDNENLSDINKITANKVDIINSPEREKNKNTQKQKQKQTQTQTQAQAQKMKLLMEGKSSTGYLPPSHQNKENDSIKMEQIEQLDKK